jgi:hypothetical protein
MGNPKMIAFGTVDGGKFVVYTRQGEQTVKMTRREYLDAVMRGKNGAGEVEPEVVEVKDKVVK